jgi:hypothetical protein
LRAATIEWLRALDYRWDGLPDRALASAERAAAAFEVAGSPQAGRVHLIAVDCGLDLAALFPDASQLRAALIGRAESAAARGLELVRAAGDENGEEVALLAASRVHRIMGRNVAIVPTLESVLYTADRLGDVPLVIQAQTALGDEFAARGCPSCARTAYIEALMSAHRSQAPAMGEWARRGLLRLPD